MNHYPHHIGDFNNATRHLTRLERSIYRDLIELYYDQEGPIENDFKKLFRKLSATTKNEIAAVRSVIEEFFTLGDDNAWHNKRCDAEIATFREKSGKAKASANKRWNKDNSSADAMRTHTEGNANQNQNQNQYIPPTPQGEPEVGEPNPAEHEDQRSGPFSDPPDSRQRFELPLNWKPGSKFAAYCLGHVAGGNPVTPEMLTDEILRDFVQSNNAKGERANQHQWEQRLAKYLAARLANPRPATGHGREPGPAAQQPPSDTLPWMFRQELPPQPPKVPKTPEEMAEIFAKRKRIMGY